MGIQFNLFAYLLLFGGGYPKAEKIPKNTQKKILDTPPQKLANRQIEIKKKYLRYILKGIFFGKLYPC
jgi:hypothetical protein